MTGYVGKNIFVAGGTSGINLDIAHAFAREGARVAVLSRSQPKVDAALELLQTYRNDVRGFAADVRDAAAVGDALRRTSTDWGPLDVVVSGAAGNFLSSAENLSPNAFKTVIDIDLLGTFNVLRSAWPHLRKPGAVLLNVSAGQSWMPMANQVHVCAAKAGIDQITRTLALEWGPSGVRVNSIAPGPIRDTEGMERLAASIASRDAWIESVPLRRFGSKHDISRAALWLCSEQADYVTGVVLPVDGGLALGGSAVIAKAMTL